MKLKKTILGGLGLLLVLTAAVYAGQSLGDLARQQREKRSKEAKGPVKEFTNDNLPARPAGEGPTAAAGMSATSAAEESTKAEPATAATEPSTEKPATESKPQEAKQQSKEEKAEDKVKTKDYWQAKFKAARAQLARAEEEQQLVEDELQLLRIRQAREISPEVQSEVAEKITSKTIEVDTRRSATVEAKNALDDLDKEFKDSGAPDEWSKTE